MHMFKLKFKIILVFLVLFSNVATGREYWEGKWAPQKKYCKYKDFWSGSGSDDPTYSYWIITKKKFQNANEDCDVTKVTSEGIIIRLVAVCSSEGIESKMDSSFIVKGDKLQFTNDKLPLYRCK